MVAEVESSSLSVFSFFLGRSAERWRRQLVCQAADSGGCVFAASFLGWCLSELQTLRRAASSAHPQHPALGVQWPERSVSTWRQRQTPDSRLSVPLWQLHLKLTQLGSERRRRLLIRAEIQRKTLNEEMLYRCSGSCSALSFVSLLFFSSSFFWTWKVFTRFRKFLIPVGVSLGILVLIFNIVLSWWSTVPWISFSCRRLIHFKAH